MSELSELESEPEYTPETDDEVPEKSGSNHEDRQFKVSLCPLWCDSGLPS